MDGYDESQQNEALKTDQPEAAPEQPRSRRRPVGRIIGIVLVVGIIIAGGVFGYSYRRPSKSAASTSWSSSTIT